MLSVLYVKSNHSFTKPYRRIIEGQNARYLQAGSVDEALKVLESEPVDAIIAAATVTGGIEELLRRLVQGRFALLPVLVVTATDSAQERAALLSLGVLDCLPQEDAKAHLGRFIEKLVQLVDSREALKSLSLALLDPAKTVHEKMRQDFAIYGIDSLHSYYTAQELFAGPDHDLYLMEIDLPDMSAARVVGKIRQCVPEAGIMIVSAIDQRKVVSDILIAGADDYIRKPFDALTLVARLEVCARRLLLSRGLEEKNRRLEELVVRDSLTGLYNHKHIIDRLAEEVEKAMRYRHTLSVVMLDIDHFKNVNDTWGHQTGDRVLVAFARLLSESTRSCDIVGRYGGEEFLVILPETGLEAALAFGNRVRERFAQMQFCEDAGLAVTVSGGIAEWKAEGHLKLIKRADGFLYRAKANGRNRIEAKRQG